MLKSNVYDEAYLRKDIIEREVTGYLYLPVRLSFQFLSYFQL